MKDIIYFVEKVNKVVVNDRDDKRIKTPCGVISNPYGTGCGKL